MSDIERKQSSDHVECWSHKDEITDESMDTCTKETSEDDAKPMPKSETDSNRPEVSPVASKGQKGSHHRVPLAVSKLSSSMESLLIDYPPGAKQNVSNDYSGNSSLAAENVAASTVEIVSKTEKSKSGSARMEYITKMENLHNLNKTEELHVGKKARPKRKFSPPVQPVITDESPLKALKAEAGRVGPISVTRKIFSNISDIPKTDNLFGCDIPPLEQLQSKGEPCIEPIPMEGCIIGREELQSSIELDKERNERKERQTEIESGVVSSGKFDPTVLKNHPEDFHADRVDVLANLIDRIIDLDRHMAMNPLVSVEGSAPQKPGLEQITSPKTAAEIADLENDFRRLLRALAHGTEDEDYAARTFKKSIHEIKRSLRKAAEGLSTTPPLPKCEDAKGPVTLEEIRKALPDLWKSTRYNNMLMEKWATSLLDWCLLDYPMNSPQQFVNCDFGVYDIQRHVDTARKTVAKLMSRWSNHNMDYPELFDLTYMMAITSKAMTLYNVLEEEMSVLKFSYTYMAAN